MPILDVVNRMFKVRGQLLRHCQHLSSKLD